MVVEREYDRLPVRAEDVDVWERDPATVRFRELGGKLDRSLIPAEKPVFEQLLVDDAGYLWVRLVREDSSAVFDIFDDRGRYLGAVSAGRGVSIFPTPVIRRDGLYAVMQDSLDVSYVVRFRVTGRTQN